MDYEKAFNDLVEKTANYITKNNLKSMVLGISGGIDSTLVAAICSQVAKKLGIPLIGRSLPSKTNKSVETDAAFAVGEGFCDNFGIVEIEDIYGAFIETIRKSDNILQSPIANGNIKARIRMTYLYNLAGLTNGIVMDTDNKTEHLLGFWTKHGDEGDLNPLSGLWKTGVFGMVDWLIGNVSFNTDQIKALKMSRELTPTDGLGISSSDVEQFGCESYDEVDEILQGYFGPAYDFAKIVGKHGVDKVVGLIKRHKATTYKRQPSPVVIESIY